MTKAAAAVIGTLTGIGILAAIIFFVFKPEKRYLLNFISLFTHYAPIYLSKCRLSQLFNNPPIPVAFLLTCSSIFLAYPAGPPKPTYPPVYTHPSIYSNQPINLPTYVPTYLLDYSPAYPPTHLPTYMTTHPPTHPLIYLLTYLPTYQETHPPLSLSTDLPIYT